MPVGRCPPNRRRAVGGGEVDPVGVVVAADVRRVAVDQHQRADPGRVPGAELEGDQPGVEVGEDRGDAAPTASITPGRSATQSSIGVPSAERIGETDAMTVEARDACVHGERAQCTQHVWFLGEAVDGEHRRVQDHHVDFAVAEAGVRGAAGSAGGVSHVDLLGERCCGCGWRRRLRRDVVRSGQHLDLDRDEFRARLQPDLRQ